MKAKELPEERKLVADGHFYSPIVSLRKIKSNEDQIWNQVTDMIPGVDLRIQEQIQFAKSLSAHYSKLPFQDEKVEGLRYQYQNDYYSYTDSIILSTIMLQLQPQRIIEVGSGYSSAVMLDINDKFFQGKIDLTFIEPFQINRLNALINKEDHSNTKILVEEVQKVDLNVFRELKAGDIFFVDTSHVVKTGSELNYILFEILPVLAKGVYIHFHDVFYPFEYPKKWVYGGRNWNEDYFLRAFLMYNSDFQIEIFGDFLHKHRPEAFAEMPLTSKDAGGSLWLQKIK